MLPDKDLVDQLWKEKCHTCRLSVSAHPRYLYHYTDAKGLEGILRTGTLWATDVRYLNDSSELNHTISRIRACLKARLAKTLGGPRQVLLEHLERSFDNFFHSSPIHVACFCQDDDLLSQWRGYGDGGGGFSLGISNHSDVHVQGRGAAREFEIVELNYNREEQQDLVERSVELCCSILDQAIYGTTGLDAESVIPEICARFRDQAYYLGMRFKDRAFAEEKEWRACCVVSACDPSAKFRSGGSARMPLIPYIELDIKGRFGGFSGSAAFETIRCGPTLDPELTKSAVERLLRTVNAQCRLVTISAVPFRGR